MIDSKGSSKFIFHLLILILGAFTEEELYFPSKFNIDSRYRATSNGNVIGATTDFGSAGHVVSDSCCWAAIDKDSL